MGVVEAVTGKSYRKNTNCHLDARTENARFFVREVLPGRSRTEIALVLYETLSEARRRPAASSGPPEVGVKSAVNTPTFSPWRAQRPVQKGWCSKVGVKTLKNTPTCTPGIAFPENG